MFLLNYRTIRDIWFSRENYLEYICLNPIKYTSKRSCVLCSFHPQIFAILKLTQASQRMSSGFSLHFSCSSCCWLKQFFKGQTVSCRIVMVLLLPSLRSSICVSLASAGMPRATPAFASLLDASSVAIYFLKTNQVFCFEN